MVNGFFKSQTSLSELKGVAPSSSKRAFSIIIIIIISMTNRVGFQAEYDESLWETFFCLS